MKIRTLVVDDDPSWRLTLSKFIQLNPLLELVATCESATEAYARLVQQDIDLLICDIEMPDLSGLGLARSLPNGPLIIFVTAHADYAIEGYAVSPVDFLLKPLDYERFLNSIEKVRKRLATPTEPVSVSPYFMIRENQEYVQIPYYDVLYMKALEHFLQIVTKEKTYMPTLTIAKMEEKIKGDLFLRVHRSYLVNRSAIAQITRNDVILTTGDSIPIGDQYRAQINRRHIDKNYIGRSN